jgi:hypothetical protein
MMADVRPVTDVAIALYAVGSLAKTVYVLVISRRNGNGNGNGHDKAATVLGSVDFWERMGHTVGEAFHAKLKPALDNQSRILEDIKEGLGRLPQKRVARRR